MSQVLCSGDQNHGRIAKNLGMVNRGVLRGNHMPHCLSRSGAPQKRQHLFGGKLCKAAAVGDANTKEVRSIGRREAVHVSGICRAEKRFNRLTQPSVRDGSPRLIFLGNCRGGVALHGCAADQKKGQAEYQVSEQVRGKTLPRKGHVQRGDCLANDRSAEETCQPCCDRHGWQEPDQASIRSHVARIPCVGSGKDSSGVQEGIQSPKSEIG